MIGSTAGRSYSWDADNYPTSLSNGSATSGFEYGTDHERIAQTLSQGGATQSIQYLADGLAENQSTGVGKSYLVGPTGVIGVANTSGGGTSITYFHRDNLGSIVNTSVQSGQDQELINYDAFGQRTVSPGPNIDSEIGYTGQLQLDPLNLVHLNGRVYDPGLGKFLSADPIVQAPWNLQSLNRYSYTWNNPASSIDPSGFEGEVAIDGNINADDNTNLCALDCGATSVGGYNDPYYEDMGPDTVYNADWGSETSSTPSSSDTPSSSTQTTGFTYSTPPPADLGSFMLSGFPAGGIEPGSTGDGADGGSSSLGIFQQSSIATSSANPTSNAGQSTGAVSAAKGATEWVGVSAASVSASGLATPKYDPSNPNYHEYSLMTEVCDSSQQFGCSAAYVFSEGLDRYAAPGLDGSKISNGETRALPGFGSVQFYVSPNQMTITNVTVPGHVFYPGSVQRSVVTAGSKVFIQTYGFGIGKWGALNSAGSIPLWRSVDAQITNALTGIYPPTKIIP